MYDIIECTSRESLIADINRRLRAGWTLVGGLTVAGLVSGETIYAQALFKPA